jgi:hypothetical protein
LTLQISYFAKEEHFVPPSLYFENTSHPVPHSTQDMNVAMCNLALTDPIRVPGALQSDRERKENPVINMNVRGTYLKTGTACEMDIYSGKSWAYIRYFLS